MEFDQLKGFYFVAKLGSFTAAASRLYLTQPAISLSEGLVRTRSQRSSAIRHRVTRERIHRTAKVSRRATKTRFHMPYFDVP